MSANVEGVTCRMTAIWHNDTSGWKMLAPTGFPDEATLHELVEEAPQMLPLAGRASLTVLGREVQLGNGYADLIAVEPSGRLCVIEVKLSRNAEARRAVIAQILTYAAYLRGMDVATLEQQVLAAHLRHRGYSTLHDPMVGNDQTGVYEPESFRTGLGDSLQHGAFRLVLVLDAAPDELVQLVGYLASIAPSLVIDLLTVAAYEVNGAQVLVPQRVDPEQQAVPDVATPATLTRTPSRVVEGAADFIEHIADAPVESRVRLQELADWAIQLERDGLVRLFTTHGKGQWTLVPRLEPDNAGLITIWNSNGVGMSFWRSVFERRAPATVAQIEALLAPVTLKQGTYVTTVSDELLSTVANAYREASG